MYPEYLQLSLEKVAEKREANTALQPERMTAEEKDVLLKGFHPDYRKDQYTELRAGANKGDKVNTELAETLMGKSRIHVGDVDLSHIDYDVDVLIIGAGGGQRRSFRAHGDQAPPRRREHDDGGRRHPGCNEAQRLPCPALP